VDWSLTFLPHQRVWGVFSFVYFCCLFWFLWHVYDQRWIWRSVKLIARRYGFAWLWLWTWDEHC